MPDLDALLAPRSVAVIGASGNPDSIRGSFMETILRHGFKGSIYPVSRSEAEVHGHKAYKHISDVPGPVDLAVLLVPAAASPAALADCAAAGVRAAVVIASGFAEEGSEQGRALQDELRSIAIEHDMALCGPNSQGFVDTRTALATTFSPAVLGLDPVLPRPAPEGRGLVIVTQSGALGFGLFDTAMEAGVPVDRVITTGNEACLSLADYLNHLVDDDRANGFLLFLEEVRDGPGFLRFAERALAAAKPIVVLRAGRSASGRRAAASHTAALAGGDAGYGAVFRHHGIVEATGTEQAVAMAGALVACAAKPDAGRRIGICSSTGGGGGLIADLCEEAGLEVPLLDDETRAAFDAVLPAYGASANPVDATAQAIRQLGYARMAGMIAASPAIDSVIAAVSGRTRSTSVEELAALQALARDCPKPIVFWSYTPPSDDMKSAMASAGIPLLTDAQAAVRVLAALARSRRLRERNVEPPPAPIEAAPLPGRRVLTEAAAYPLLEPFGARTGGYGLATSADEAVARHGEIGRPVALKVQSPDIAHKSDAGGVALGLDSEAAVRDAWDRIMARVREAAPEAAIDGLLVQEMAAPGVEVILGVTVDPRFGPLLMVGLGGVLVEVIGDVALAPVPLSPAEARELFEGLKGWPLLAGVRGGAESDVEALCQLVAGLSRFAWHYRDDIAEIDLNPVIVHRQGQGVTVVDALIVRRGAYSPSSET